MSSLILIIVTCYQLKDDAGFHEFLEAHKNRSTKALWSNDALSVDRTAKSKGQKDSEDEGMEVDSDSGESDEPGKEKEESSSEEEDSSEDEDNEGTLILINSTIFTFMVPQPIHSRKGRTKCITMLTIILSFVAEHYEAV